MYWPTKRPSEELDYTLDWDMVIGSSSILSSSWILPDTTSLISTNEYFDSNETTIWLYGGDPSESPYLITNIIVTNLDQTYSQDVYLPIYYVLANVCDVTGVIMSPTGEPSFQTECFFSNIPDQTFVNISESSVSIETDTNGYFSTPLIIGASYRVYIPDLGLMAAFTVPDTTSANVFELINP